MPQAKGSLSPSCDTVSSQRRCPCFITAKQDLFPRPKVQQLRQYSCLVSIIVIIITNTRSSSLHGNPSEDWSLTLAATMSFRFHAQRSTSLPSRHLRCHSGCIRSESPCCHACRADESLSLHPMRNTLTFCSFGSLINAKRRSWPRNDGRRFRRHEMHSHDGRGAEGTRCSIWTFVGFGVLCIQRTRQLVGEKTWGRISLPSG